MACSQRRVDSLKSINIDYVVKNLEKYMSNTIALKLMPPLIKDSLLRKFTSTSYYWVNIDFNEALYAFIHPMTKRIDLSLVNVDDDILEILKECGNLRAVYLTRNKNTSITNEGLNRFLSRLKNLYMLQVSNCQAVDDDVLKTISENCTNLAGLDISGCMNVSDIGIEELAILGNLNWLTFSATQVTNRGVEKIVEGASSSSLKELRLSNCKYITSEILSTISRHCPNIEILVYYNLEPFDNDNRTCFSLQEGNFKNLKQINWTVKW